MLYLFWVSWRRDGVVRLPGACTHPVDAGGVDVAKVRTPGSEVMIHDGEKADTATVEGTRPTVRWILISERGL